MGLVWAEGRKNNTHTLTHNSAIMGLRDYRIYSICIRFLCIFVSFLIIQIWLIDMYRNISHNNNFRRLHNNNLR